MKYTVVDIMTSHILVKFDNGSSAHVSIEPDWDKERIEDEISKFIPAPMEQKAVKNFNSIEDVPLSLGESNDIEPYYVKIKKLRLKEEQLRKAQVEKREKLRKESEELHKNRPVHYDEARSSKYPSLSDQLDALYWSRNGDNSKLEKIDEQINQIKEKYPKDMEPILAKEFYKQEKNVMITMNGHQIEVPQIED